MMVAENYLSGDLQSMPSQILEKPMRPRNATKREHLRRPFHGRRKCDVALYSPNSIWQYRKFLQLYLVRHHHGIRTPKRTQRLAQATHRQQYLVRIIGCKQHNIEIACQMPMLKSVVQQVYPRPEALLGVLSCCKSVSTDNHLRRVIRSLRGKVLCQQQGLIAKLRRRAIRIHDFDFSRVAPISTRKNIEGDATLNEPPAQQLREGSLAGASNA